MPKSKFIDYTLSVEGCNYCNGWPCYFCGDDSETKGGGPILMAVHKKTGELEDVCRECAAKVNALATKIYYDLEEQLFDRLLPLIP